MSKITRIGHLIPARAIALAAALVIALCAPAFSSDQVKVSNIRYRTSDDFTRVVLDLSGPVNFEEHRLEGPDRIFIDVKGTSAADGLNDTVDIGDGRLKSVRTGQFDQDTMRVVLDVENINDYKVFQLNEPSRIVIDIYPANAKARKAPEPVRQPVAKPEKRTIIIDAGHGGHDPGAIGKRGLKEKTVTLQLALALKDLLSQDPMNKIVLTRSKDEYLTLKERIGVAEKNNADLFISIHINANNKRSVTGFETYFLSWTDDEEVLKLASKENKRSISDMRKDTSELDLILDSLTLQFKRDESHKLANYINNSVVSSLSRNYDNINDLGVKKGPFYVLYTKGIPSVLVECSFISNPTEEKRLKSKSYISQLASGLADGVNTYIASIPPEFQLARR